MSPDVVVIGGGPAGSTVSTLLAQHGRRVQLFERETFPRFHIGESLIPETYWVLKRLGMLDEDEGQPLRQEAQRAVRQRQRQAVGAVLFLRTTSRTSARRPGRSSAASSTRCCSRTPASTASTPTRASTSLEVIFEGERAVGVKVAGRTAPRREVRAPVVVDASGQAAMLMNRNGLRIWDPLLNKGAIWTYYEGAATRRQPRRGCHARHADAGQARLVVEHPAARRSPELRHRPAVRATSSRTAAAHRADLPRGESSTRRTSSIASATRSASPATSPRATTPTAPRELAGDGWVLVGRRLRLPRSALLVGRDAGAQVGRARRRRHPRGAREAATPRRRALGVWAPMFNQGIDRMRRLVCEYYDGFNFGTFMRHHPELRGTITDLLIGDLFTDDGRSRLGADGRARRRREDATSRRGTPGLAPRTPRRARPTSS